MKQGLFVIIVLVIALATGFIIWSQLPDYLKEVRLSDFSSP